MTERVRSAGSAVPLKTEHDLSPRKTLLVLVIVVGCFAILWPKVFYPMLVGSAKQHSKPSPIDKTTGCCDVISETDVTTIKILNELCGSILNGSEPGRNKQTFVQKCRKEILETCGIDVEAVLQEQVRLGHVKQILEEIRSLNGSLCLKYHYGVAPWRLGVPHRITVKMGSPDQKIKQERPPHLRAEMMHPAFRERGQAIPQPQTSSQIPRAPSRVIEGRPGPVPGMRPTIGGAGHVVPPSKHQSTSSMSIIMPIYTMGIVIFFTYTLMKILFKKQPDGAALYPPIEPDADFRREVFESELSRLAPRRREPVANKIGRAERDARDEELDHLRRRLRDTELAMERIVDQLSKVPLKVAQELSNGTLSNGTALKVQDDQTTVKVLGMEMTASCEGGKKWTRPDSPVMPVPSPQPAKESSPPPQEIYLEGALPAQSHLLVTNSATEPQTQEGEDPAVVLAGKVTLSVVNLDENGSDVEEENRQEPNIDEDLEEKQLIQDIISREEDKLEEQVQQLDEKINALLNLEREEGAVNILEQANVEDINAENTQNVVNQNGSQKISEIVVENIEHAQTLTPDAKENELANQDSAIKEETGYAEEKMEVSIKSEPIQIVLEDAVSSIIQQIEENVEDNPVPVQEIQQQVDDLIREAIGNIVNADAVNGNQAAEQTAVSHGNQTTAQAVSNDNQTAEQSVSNGNQTTEQSVSNGNHTTEEPASNGNLTGEQVSNGNQADVIEIKEVLTDEEDLASDEEVVDEIEEVVYEEEVSEEEEEEVTDDDEESEIVNGGGKLETKSGTAAENDISDEELNTDEEADDSDYLGDSHQSDSSDVDL